MLLSTPFDDFIDLLAKLNASEQPLKAGSVSTHASSDSNGEHNFRDLRTWLKSSGIEEGSALREAHICLFTSNYQHGEDLEHAIGYAEKAGRGQTALNEACKDRGVGLRVLEMAPSMPHSLDKEWPEKDCMAAVAFGMEATAAGGDMLGIATLAAGADIMVDRLITALEKIPEEDTLVPTDSRAKEILECFRKNGGREVAAVIGALTAARTRQLPVLLEGDAAIAGLYILWRLDKSSIKDVQIAVPSSTKANSVCRKLGKQPILNTQNNFEAGCGVAVAMSTLSTVSSIN